MEISVNRFRFTDTKTYGDLAIDGSRYCYSLEDRVREEVAGQPVAAYKVKGETAIPVGRYRLTIDYSPHFGRDMIHVNDVPGFTGVRVHSGETEADTDGCILVGDVVTPKGISGGKLRGILQGLEDRVRRAIDAGEEVWLTVTGLR